MNKNEIKAQLNELTKDIDAMPVAAKSAMMILVNLVEILAEQNASLQEMNQQLKDEINRLKGEQGKPNIKGKTKGDDDDNSDHSSEDERNGLGNRKPRKPKNSKTRTVKVNRTVVVGIDKAELPEDAVFKGYVSRIFQNVKIIPDNVEFKLSTYYSPSQKKTFTASLPAGYHGEFGPDMRSLVIMLYRDSGMSEPAIVRFLRTFDIQISSSTISRMITEGHEQFHQEKEAIISAGLKATTYQHLDDTGCRVNGENWHTHILCNPYFTAYFTRPKKDRLTILDVVCRGQLKFKLSQDSYDLMAALGLRSKWLDQLKPLMTDEALTAGEMDRILRQLFPNSKKQRTNRHLIREAAALIYYRQSEFALKYLMSDDAKQFGEIAEHHALCWVHEGRHYKKLAPLCAVNQRIVEAFITEFWDYYHALKAYQANPTPELAADLDKRFGSLFTTKTPYGALNQCIARTYAKKTALLLALTYPFLPLHNNPAELGARVQARMRDINLHTITVNGTETKDTFATIAQTARKLGVNIYNYIYDRISKRFEMPALADLITLQAARSFNTT